MDQRLPSGWSHGEQDFYVSITGLKTKGLLGFLFFIRHAIPSKVQAEEQNLSQPEAKNRGSGSLGDLGPGGHEFRNHGFRFPEDSKAAVSVI